MTDPMKNAILVLIFGVMSGMIIYMATDAIKNSNDVPLNKIEIGQLKETVRDHEQRIRAVERHP